MASKYANTFCGSKPDKIPMKLPSFYYYRIAGENGLMVVLSDENRNMSRKKRELPVSGYFHEKCSERKGAANFFLN